MATSAIQNLPTIVKREILYPKLSEKEAFSERQRTTTRIISILGVNFADEEEMGVCIGEFNAMLSRCDLTSAEVIEAYRMVIEKKFDYKVYPTLSLIQCGEILDLYQEFKRNSKVREHALKMIREEREMVEKSEEEQQEIEDSFDKMVFDELQTKGYSDACHVYYKKLQTKGKLRDWNVEMKRRFFNYVQKKYVKSKIIQNSKNPTSKTRGIIDDLKRRSKEGLPEVKVLCENIFASNYLKKFKTFEEFKTEIK